MGDQVTICSPNFLPDSDYDIFKNVIIEFPAFMDNPPKPRALFLTYEEAELEKQRKKEEKAVVRKKPNRDRYSYTHEQKVWAVQQLRTGRSAKDIAKDLGPHCSHTTVLRWKRQSWRWMIADMEIGDIDSDEDNDDGF